MSERAPSAPHHFPSSQWQNNPDISPLSDDEGDDEPILKEDNRNLLHVDVDNMLIVSTKYDPALQENKYRYRRLSREELWEETEAERKYAKDAYRPSSFDDMKTKVSVF